MSTSKKSKTEENWDELLQHSFNGLTLYKLRQTMKDILSVSDVDLDNDESLFIAYATIESILYHDTFQELVYSFSDKRSTILLYKNFELHYKGSKKGMIGLIISDLALHPKTKVKVSVTDFKTINFTPFIGSEYYHIYLVYQLLTRLQFTNNHIVTDILQQQIIQVVDGQKINVVNEDNTLKKSELNAIQEYAKDKNLVRITFQHDLTFDSVLSLIDDMGIFPAYSGRADAQITTHAFLEYARNNISLDELQWWGYYKFNQGKYFKLQTLLDIVKHAKKFRYSLPLHFIAPDLVYETSGRIKTDMSMFQSVHNEIVDLQTFRNLKSLPVYYPVTRYADSKMGSLFFGDDEEEKEKYCGTFYYYEPESTTLIHSPTTLVAYNKYDAVLQLLNMGYLDDPIYWEANDVTENYGYSDYRGWMTDDGKMTPYQFMQTEQYKTSLTHHEGSWTPTAENPGQPFYIGYVAGLYAQEDEFDQILCKFAQIRGYTGVALTRMIGGTALVSEFLDVRSRSESFQSLVYLDPSLHCKICKKIEPEYTCSQCMDHNSVAFCSQKCLEYDH